MNLNLINQAIQKGYISGVTFIDLINKEEFTISNRKELYAPYPVEDKLYVKVNKHKSLPNKTACIYKNGEWAEIVDIKKLFIEKAKKNYPVGTRYKGAHDGLEYTVEENIRNMYEIYLSGNIDAGFNKDYFYYRNRWAEIVEIDEVFSKDAEIAKLLEKAYRDYTIGTKFKSISDNNIIREIIPYRDVNKVEFEYDEYPGKTVIRISNGIRNRYAFDHYLGCSNPVVYENGVWCEIVEQPKINYNSLIKDEIYYTEYSKSQSPHIFKYISGNAEKGIANKCIHSNESYTNSTRLFHGSYLYNLRIATTEEKKWLNVCIKADTFIPKENIHLYDDNTFELINSNEIKIGDWIYTLENSGGDGMSSSDENKVFKVLGYNQIDSNLLVLDPKSNDTTCTPGKISVNKKNVIKYDMKNKIIGYKCPMNLFGGVIIKNTIWTKHNNQKYGVNDYDGYFMPNEIVETWEPVYKNSLKVDDFILCTTNNISFLKEGMIGKVSNVTDKIYFNHILQASDYIGSDLLSYSNGDKYKILSAPELYEYSKLPVINGYTGEYIKNETKIKYGCAIINIDILFNIYKNNYDSNRPIDKITTSNNVDITFDDIKKICTAIFIINNM